LPVKSMASIAILEKAPQFRMSSILAKIWRDHSQKFTLILCTHKFYNVYHETRLLVLPHFTAVSVTCKNSIGHIPRKLSRYVWWFIEHGGMVDGPELILPKDNCPYQLRVGEWNRAISLFLTELDTLRRIYRKNLGLDAWFNDAIVTWTTQTSFTKLPQLKMTVKLTKTKKQLCHGCIYIICILLSLSRLDIIWLCMWISRQLNRLKKISSGWKVSGQNLTGQKFAG
jgi:hypothetical protein